MIEVVVHPVPLRTDEIKSWIYDMWNVKIINPRALVVAVYTASTTANDEDVEGERPTKMDSNGLLPGQVLVNTGGEWEEHIGAMNVPAWIVVPYGLRVDTAEDQRGTSREERAINQSFGFYASPRVGDTVFLVGVSNNRTGTAMEYYVLGTPFGAINTTPPPIDSEDLQLVHRSGASIRLNDTFGGGGSITSSGGNTGPEHMYGLTGNLSMTGNRVMILAGRKYLPHGLLSKYGDPRSPFRDYGIDVYDGALAGYKYSDKFDNDVTATQMFDPFEDTTIGLTTKFLSPPDDDDPIIPLNDNTLLLLQQGGGVIRIDDHNQDDEYSRLTMAASSMSLMVGKEYRDVGLKGDSSSPGGDAEGIDSSADVFEVQHKSGSRIKIDSDGNIEIFVANGKDVTIKDPNGDGSIYIGEGSKQAIRDGDSTTSDKAVAAYMGVPDALYGNLGLPATHMHAGHSHTVKKSQDKTYV